MFSGVVLVDGLPERSSSSTDVRPSLKRLYHKKFSFGSWYFPRLPVAFGVFLKQFFLKIETKFRAHSLLLKVRHISCKKIAGSLKHNLTKMR